MVLAPLHLECLSGGDASAHSTASAARVPFDIFDDGARWTLTNLDNRTQQIELKPRLVTSDLRVRLQAAVRGIGIALLPE
jgi:DNA-binding transcriptional LysR family regulator